MKWGKKFQAADVNTLYNAVNRNLRLSHRFVCLTDSAEGIIENVECFPIPEIGLDRWYWYNGAWPKLSVFLPDLYGLTGRCLFVDLDTLILDDLVPFFEESSAFIGIDAGVNWDQELTRRILGTGIFAFDLGAQAQIIEKFYSQRKENLSKYKLEQAFVQNAASSLDYWPRGWVISFKYHLQRRNLSGLVLEPRTAFPGTKIIAFHGNPSPRDLLKSGIWGRFPHLGRGTVSWVSDYYIENANYQM
ncbi:MAG: hypothetical protein OXI87_10715 [Albidovulum sp.]|nr:hypothetical protein [Albidovulum sp.]